MGVLMLSDGDEVPGLLGHLPPEVGSASMPPCPQCGGQMRGATAWWTCSADGCGYEMTDEAHALYTALSDLFEKDPAAFVAAVTAYRDEVRALEPAWRR